VAILIFHPRNLRDLREKLPDLNTAQWGIIFHCIYNYLVQGNMRRLVLVLLVSAGGGAVPSLWAQQFSLRQYTVADGLPQSQVNVIIEDKQGYLWIGTHGGLARFDGRDFKVYNTLDGLASNSVTSLMIDQHRDLWIVHPRSITKFDGVTFRKFQVPSQSGSLKRIRRIIDLQDSIVILSNNQGAIGKIQHDSVYYWSRPIAGGKAIFSALRSPTRDVLFYLNDSSFLAISPSGNRKIISHKERFGKVYNMLNYKRDLILDTDSGFFSLDADQGSFYSVTLPVRHHLIAYDSLNSIFWTREQNTFFREREENGKTRVDTIFKDVTINQILFDAEGNTWLATSENGLYKYSSTDFERCVPEKLNSVVAVEKDTSGAMWIASNSKGLWKVHKGKIKMYALGDKRDCSVFAIKVSPKGELWVASSSGLGRYREADDDFVWYKRQDGLSSQYVLNLDFDERGGVWCGTNGAGLNYFDGKRFKSFSSEDGLLSRTATAIKYIKKDKSLYVGSEFGLNVIRGNKVSEIHVPELVNTSIISIHGYNDSLLMLGTTGAGIVMLNPVSGKHKLLTTKEGLLSNFINFVAQDKNREVWIGTEKGITRIRLNGQLEIMESIHYGNENGLTGLETNQDAFYLGDEKYFGLIDGVYQYHDLANPTFNTYDLHLTDVDIFYGEFQSRNYSDSSYGFFKIPYHLSLAPDKNHITFRFNRVEKRYPNSIKYKYFLENFDKTWSQPSPLGQVTYGNLPPGDYVLNVLATNNRGRWDAVPLRYPFVIQTRFYQRSAFIVGAIILGVGFTILILYLNVRRNVEKRLKVERVRQREQDSLRKEIARDFHDEMGNQLTRIINYISLIKLSGNGHAKELYDKVEDSAKYLYTGTRDFIWSIDPGNDELSKVFIHIRDFGEKLFEEKHIQFRAFNEVKETVRIPYGFSREVNFIIKEAMTNAFNHSQAGNVSFTLRQDENEYEMRLEDDGVGFIPETVERNGIKNMQARAGRMDSTLCIQTDPDQGTVIRILFPKTKTTKLWPSLQKKEF
jgi:ligand-binding sensor domain-containing protein/signal transduction histidine kinase